MAEKADGQSVGPTTRQGHPIHDNQNTRSDCERDDLIGRLVDALSKCDRVIQERMTSHFTRADADYGRRVAQGLDLPAQARQPQQSAARTVPRRPRPCIAAQCPHPAARSPGACTPAGACAGGRVMHEGTIATSRR